METDQHFLRRAMRLAMNGRGRVEPNPMVGCVIVRDGRVIGEGFHEQFGGPHAEPNALAACARAGESTAGASAYVTLEPCCHTNKKTPPCAPRLIEAKLSRVVIGCLDPNPAVNGKGIATLRAAGIEVVAPVLEAEAKQLIAPFLATTALGRPYVTLKWAESADGKVAGPGGRRTQISNERSMRLVNDVRARSDGILVGVNTVLTDDPLLTARGNTPSRLWVRFVLDSQLLTPETSRLVRTAVELPVVICCRKSALEKAPARTRELKEAGVFFVTWPDKAGEEPGLPLREFFEIFGSDVLEDIHERALEPLTHMVVEPGPTLASSFFCDNLVDRLWVIRSPNRINDDTAPAAAPVPAHFLRTGELDLDGDRLTEYLNPSGHAFFAAEPSADLVLAPA